MSHLVLLRLQIEAVVLLRIDLDRHALMDLKSEAGKSVDLLRIVRENLKDFTPRSLKICAPIQYSLRSGAKPSLILASTVSKPCS